jgi:hypothetical protein
MAIQSDKLDFSQPDNALSQIAEEQRKKLFPRNDFKPTDPYSSVHPDAIADGDKIAEFESRIIEKVDECWEDILKTFKDEVNVVNVNDELGEVDEDVLKNAIH